MLSSEGLGVRLAVFPIEAAGDVAMGIYLVYDGVRVAAGGSREDVELSMAGEFLQEGIQVWALVHLVEGTLGCFLLGDA